MGFSHHSDFVGTGLQICRRTVNISPKPYKTL